MYEIFSIIGRYFDSKKSKLFLKCSSELQLIPFHHFKYKLYENRKFDF